MARLYIFAAASILLALCVSSSQASIASRQASASTKSGGKSPLSVTRLTYSYSSGAERFVWIVAPTIS